MTLSIANPSPPTSKRISTRDTAADGNAWWVRISGVTLLIRKGPSSISRWRLSTSSSSKVLLLPRSRCLPPSLDLPSSSASSPSSIVCSLLSPFPFSLFSTLPFVLFVSRENIYIYIYIYMHIYVCMESRNQGKTRDVAREREKRERERGTLWNPLLYIFDAEMQCL